MIWREKRILLIVLAVLFAANTIFFFTYRVQYEQRLEGLESRLDQVKSQLEEARRARVGAEQQVAAYRKVERDIEQIYNTKWATQDQRLTRLIAEVKRLTVQSQLAPPKSISFTQAVSKNVGGTTDRNAKVVGIGFTVEGSYQQVRQLINKLELSDQFVIIDQVGLSSDTGQNLIMTLHVKTLFRDGTAPRHQEL